MPRALKTVAATVVLLLVSCMALAENDTPAQAPSHQEMFWEHYLYLAGQRLDCHFTIEKLARRGDDPRARGVFVFDDQELRTVDDVIAKVSQTLKGFSFTKSEAAPTVIHVIEDELVGLAGYPLEQTVDIAYAGVPHGLIEELEKRNQGLEARRGGDNRLMFDDYWTEITVEAKAQQVRRILTDCIPLNTYHPILWRAETDRVDGRLRTIVQYYGPRRPAEDWVP